MVKPELGRVNKAVDILRQALISGNQGRFYDVQRLLDDFYASLTDRIHNQDAQCALSL